MTFRRLGGPGTYLPKKAIASCFLGYMGITGEHRSTTSTSETILHDRMSTAPEVKCIDCAEPISDGSVGPKCKPCKKKQDDFVGADENDPWYRGLWQDRAPPEDTAEQASVAKKLATSAATAKTALDLPTKRKQ